MKVISIIQPWATLIALGEKKFETRSWATKHRGELGIHASKKVDKLICEQEPFKTILAKHGYTAANLPNGVILGTTILDDCFHVRINNGDSAIIGANHLVSGNEYAFGDYSKGRFAWEMSDMKQIEPIPAKGQLGLWNSDELDTYLFNKAMGL